MASLVFPEDYGEKHGKGNIPMIGFQAIEIEAKSDVANLGVTPLQEWVWLPVPIEGLSTAYENAWEKADVNIAAAAATAGDPITVAVSSDGSVFAVGYSATSGDNASIQIFYDE